VPLPQTIILTIPVISANVSPLGPVGGYAAQRIMLTLTDGAYVGENSEISWRLDDLAGPGLWQGAGLDKTSGYQTLTLEGVTDDPFMIPESGALTLEVIYLSSDSVVHRDQVTLSVPPAGPAFLDIPNFVLSLGVALAGLASPAVVFGGGGAAGDARLFAHQAVENAAMGRKDHGAYAVLRTYGGPSPDLMLPIPELSLQIMARHEYPAKSLELACRLYNALFEAASTAGGGLPTQPRHRWTVAAKKESGGVIVDDLDANGGAGVYYVLLLKPGPMPQSIGVNAETRMDLVSVNFNAVVTTAFDD
jgi:hypothetical protein